MLELPLPFTYSKVTTPPKEYDDLTDEELASFVKSGPSTKGAEVTSLPVSLAEEADEPTIYEYENVLLNKDLISLVGTKKIIDNFNWTQEVYAGIAENDEYFTILTDNETVEWSLEPTVTITNGGKHCKIQWTMTQ